MEKSKVDHVGQQIDELMVQGNWASKVRVNQVDRWVQQFPPKERPIALALLRNLIYYDEASVEDDCRILHTLLAMDLDEGYLQNAMYVGLGGIAESGPFLCYFYRTKNNLPVDRFVHYEDVTKIQDTDRLVVFIDDFIGSGTQCTRFWEERFKPLTDGRRDIRFRYLALAGFEESLDEIEKSTGFGRPLVVHQLDDRNRALHVASGVFDDAMRPHAERCLVRLGKRLWPEYPLGYKDGQALISFFYNTPNNTLPVLWKKESFWEPLFPRHEKVRSVRLVVQSSAQSQNTCDSSARLSFEKVNHRLIQLIRFYDLLLGKGSHINSLLNTCKETLNATSISTWVICGRKKNKIWKSTDDLGSIEPNVIALLDVIRGKARASHGRLPINKRDIESPWTLCVPIGREDAVLGWVVALRGGGDEPFNVLDQKALKGLAKMLYTRIPRP